MAFVSGNTLTSLVDQRHSASETIVVISKVARALHQAHQQGVIHRDLKPANIMIDDESEPVVMDFGLARRNSGDDQPQLTQAGQIMGTPAYMPPEQIAGRNEEIGPACDIYGLGVILYELLAGKRPFNGDLLQLMSQIALESPPALRSINDQIDPQLETIVLKSLEKKSGDRWESMLAFAEALEAWEPTSLPGTEQTTTTRRLALIAVGLLGIIALVWAAVILLKVDTPAGTIVLDINQPELVGAVVTIDGKEKITIKTEKGQETIGIRPDEMRHELKVTLAGFKTFSKEFTFDTGNNQHIEVALEPLKPQVATKSEFIWPKDQPAAAIAPFDAVQAKKHQEEWAEHLGVAVEKEVELPGGEKMVFMLIPPGEFMMGSSEEEQAKLLEEATAEKSQFAAAQITKEVPQHRVRITKPFYLGKHLVTQAQWQSVMGDNPANCKDSPSHPVENVSWNDVQIFLSNLDIVCALPTEAQWEYACRAGTTTTRSFGDSRLTWPQHMSFYDNCNKKPHAVGELRPNPFGLHDMIGNLWEWCADWFGDSYTTSDLINDPTGPATGLNRVRRGGCWVDKGALLRSATRVNNNPSNRNDFSGLRVAIAINTAKP